MIHFSSGRNLEILNITFSDCTVVLSFITNIKMRGVMVRDGKLIIDNQMLDFHFTPINRQQDNNLNLKKYCEHQECIDILQSTFQNSIIAIQGSTDVLMDDYLYTSCLDVCIQSENPWAISTYHAYSVTLSDVTIGNSSSPLLYLFVTNFITFDGYNLFNRNRGRGINITIVGSINIESNTELKFIGNAVSSHLLHVCKNVQDRRTGRVHPLNFQRSAIIFERNRVEKGSILVLESILLKMDRMSLTFENNTSLMVGTKQTNPITIFLLKASEVILHNSNLLFVGNTAAMLIKWRNYIFRKHLQN